MSRARLIAGGEVAIPVFSSYRIVCCAMGMCSVETFNKFFTVAILTAINLLNYMDRFTLAGQ